MSAKTPPARSQASSLVEASLGASYAGLAPELQQFHRLQGSVTLSGWAQVQAPASPLARAVSALLGCPCEASCGPFIFELHASPEREVWVRHFAGKALSSSLRLSRGKLQERLGPAVLVFDLQTAAGELVFKLAGLRLCGVPCPRRWLPRVLAKERGEEGFVHFEVTADLPLVGRVAGYRGRLQVAQEEPT